MGKGDDLVLGKERCVWPMRSRLPAPQGWSLVFSLAGTPSPASSIPTCLPLPQTGPGYPHEPVPCSPLITRTLPSSSRLPPAAQAHPVPPHYPRPPSTLLLPAPFPTPPHPSGLVPPLHLRLHHPGPCAGPAACRGMGLHGSNHLHHHQDPHLRPGLLRNDQRGVVWGVCGECVGNVWSNLHHQDDPHLCTGLLRNDQRGEVGNSWGTCGVGKCVVKCIIRLSPRCPTRCAVGTVWGLCGDCVVECIITKTLTFAHAFSAMTNKERCEGGVGNVWSDPDH